ncbi:MAG: type II toxin-antitoxin system HicA family toxin [Acetobacteraceae bacterium]
MKGSELVPKIRAYARKHGLRFEYEPRRGKGSHGQLLLGNRLTTIKDPKKEIGPGLLGDMLKQLGITRNDLS